METRQLGDSDLHITRVGFGSWATGGGGWTYGWGPQDDAESIGAIHRALDLGINWIDTAAIYGLGHSEEVVARALEGMSEPPLVFTKCGLTWDDAGNIIPKLKADSVRAECEASLRRLKVERIDLYQIHWPNPAEDIEEAWRVLVELKETGKVRHIAVSNFDVDQMKRVAAIAPITSLQPPYSMVRRGIEAAILPHAQEQNIGVIVYSPMQAGLLTGKMTRARIAAMPDDDWRRKAGEFQEPQLTKNLELQRLLVELGAELGRSAAELAVAWTLTHPAVTAAIVGARRPDQVDGFAQAGARPLPEETLARINAHLAAAG